MRNYSVKRSTDDVTVKSTSPETQTLETKNNRKFTDLISEEILSEEIRMVLVNAVSFRGIWNFRVDRTSKADFQLNDKDTVEVEFIEMQKDFKYGEFREFDATAVELPFKDSEVSMIVILPNTSTGLSALEEKLQSISWFDVSSKMLMSTVHVKIPMFEIEFNTELDLEAERVRKFCCANDRNFITNREYFRPR